MYRPILKQIINLRHSLVQLSDEIPWEEFERSFSNLYSEVGTPAKPIRLMVSLLILKQLKGLGDETVIKEWVQNPYFQYFSGEAEFQWDIPCDPSDLVHFRNRIGPVGVEKILEVSIRIQPSKQRRRYTDRIVIDTTAQEKNITYPTDVKLRRKVIEKCLKIARAEGIALRQTYTRTVKKLVLQQRFAHHPKNWKRAHAAKRKLKTIAGRLIRELGRKLPQLALSRHQSSLALFNRVINQQRGDKKKIYSLHEPHVACIAKGKVAKKYEFGSKVSVAMSRDGNMILGVVNFSGNPHDGKTVAETLKQVERLTGKKVKSAVVDRGYRTRRRINGTQIISPQPVEKKHKARMRRYFRRRAAIEPVIGHLKNQYGLKRNYLKGEKGDVTNALLAGAAFNFKRWLNQKLEELAGFIKKWTFFHRSQPRKALIDL